MNNNLSSICRNVVFASSVILFSKKSIAQEQECFSNKEIELNIKTTVTKLEFKRFIAKGTKIYINQSLKPDTGILGFVGMSLIL